MPPISTPMQEGGASGRAAAEDRVIDHQHDDRAYDRNKQAVEVEPADALSAEQAEQETADQRADNAEHDIQKKAFAALIDDLAADPAGDQAEDDPGKDGHGMSLPIRARFGPLLRKPARLPPFPDGHAPIASLTH